MNRNRKGAMPDINRETYKNVKKLDRQQFMQFCADLYRFGYEDGRDSVPGMDVESIYKVIASTKGIGPKKLEDIKASIEVALGGKKDE